jgi:hypothetical protein
MKAGDISVVQYDTGHGGLRVLPLRSVAELASLEVVNGLPHNWVVVAYATDQGKAHERMRAFKEKLKEGGGDV